MIPHTWQVADDPRGDSPLAPPPPLASLQFLIGALRRRWWVCTLMACVGLSLGVGWVLARPPLAQATATLYLTHQDGVDPSEAMATDLNLMHTRTVAARVVSGLQLPLTPEQFQDAITATASTQSLLTVTVAAPTPAEARARVGELTRVYLGFRAAQVSAQAKAQIANQEARINELEHEVGRLAAGYDRLSKGSAAQQAQAIQLLSTRTQLANKIDSIRQDVDKLRLQNTSLVASSRVLDPPSRVRVAVRRTVALAGFSGLVGGGAAGAGLVLTQAILSDRLRRREEVAAALGVPVRFSVTRLPAPWWAALIARVTRRGTRGSVTDPALEVLVDAVCATCRSARPGRDATPARSKGSERASGATRHPATRIAVGTIGDDRGAALVVGTVAARLADEARTVFVVDLSDSGRLEGYVDRAIRAREDASGPSSAPVVLRPEGVPSLARGPVAKNGADGALPTGSPERRAWSAADVALCLVSIDPAIGVDQLSTWAQEMILVVPAGMASAERLRTTGELVRAAGLKVAYAVLVGADRADQSLGRPPTDESATGTDQEAFR